MSVGYFDGTSSAYKKTAGTDKIQVDSVLSSTSEYPVQNKAITNNLVMQCSLNSSGLIDFQNRDGSSLFTLQLPLYDGGVS